jgi:hypothetical protein
MKAKLLALWALLFVVDNLSLRKVQIMGDTKTTVDWVNGHFHLHVSRLKPSMVQIFYFLLAMDWFSISHIYRELNSLADELSKESLSLDEGIFNF